MKSNFEIRIGEGVRSRDCTVFRYIYFNTPRGDIVSDLMAETLTEKEVFAIQDWVHDNRLGRRISWATWRLVDDAAVTSFVLKWSKQGD